MTHTTRNRRRRFATVVLIALTAGGAAIASAVPASAYVVGGGGGTPMNCSTSTTWNSYGQLAVGRCTNPSGGVGSFTLHATCAGLGPYDSPTIFVDPGVTAVTNVQCWASPVTALWITQY